MSEHRRPEVSALVRSYDGKRKVKVELFPAELFAGRVELPAEGYRVRVDGVWLGDRGKVELHDLAAVGKIVHAALLQVAT